MLLPYLEDNRVEAGCDEVGRGCLSGPVVAAAVILPPDFANDWVNDSKKISKASRESLVHEIKKEALAWSLAEASVQEIDRINILNASFLAMERAVLGLGKRPDHLLIDGNRFMCGMDIPYTCIIKGDGKMASIAAASILAKVHRDSLMEEYAKTYPGYGWEQNVGYPTRFHRQAIKELGATPLHRKSFQLLPRQLSLGL
jgi:ribonuclease HII